MSEHYAGSCPPGQHCCLCAEDELKKRLAAAEACCAELSSRVHEVDAARTERIVELEQRLAAAEGLLKTVEGWAWHGQHRSCACPICTRLYDAARAAGGGE